MEDHQIIEGFLNRDQTALDQARRKYGDDLRAAAERILGDDRAAEAAVREALCRAWDTIPPKEPKNLKAYLLRLTRDLAVDHTSGNGEYHRVLRELERCVPQQGDGSDGPLSGKELRRAADEFLSGLAPDKRRIFVLRYWYLCSVEEISRRCGGSSDRIRGVLKQIRGKLRAFLLSRELPGLSAVRFLRVFGTVRDRWILEAEGTKRALPLWVKGAAVGAAVCCAVALGVFLFSRQAPPEETQPPQSSTAEPKPSTEESTEGPTAETTAPPTETAETPVTESAIHASTAYQKLLSIHNAEQFDPSVLEAFAQWIEERSPYFLEEYPDKWKLEERADGTFGLTCYTPLSEDSFRILTRLVYDGVNVSTHSSEERPDINVSRSEVAAKVYGAADHIGVSDVLKEAFVDCIMESDWFLWRVFVPEVQTEWYFERKPLYNSMEQTEYITLFAKVWKPGQSENDYTLCSLYYDGTAVLDRCQKEPHSGQAPVNSIRDTVYYQKLLSLENADQFDPSVLEAFAQWIEEHEAWFPVVYPERWKLEQYASDTVGLVCCTPLNEEYERHLYVLNYDGDRVSHQASVKRHYTSVPREEVAAKVYGAEDPVGVPDELKEEFIEFIMDSDWFAWSVFSPSYEKTEWYFVQEPLRPESEDQTEYIKLCVDVWSSGLQGADFSRNWLWYNENEQEVWDGGSDSVMEDAGV